MRMKRYAQMIYMLSQCKDVIDNPAACANEASRIECELKNLNLGGYSHRINQSGACSSSDVITSGGRKSQTTMEDKVIVVVCGYPELYIHLRTFTKTGIHFATRLELPPMTSIRVCCVVNFTREWREFHAWMKRVNSKCSSVQLRANSAIYSLHSHLVWTHLYAEDLKRPSCTASIQ